MSLKNDIEIYLSHNDVSIVSFDLYGTLVRRIVDDPRLVFSIVEARYNVKHKQSIINFERDRIHAENKARKGKNEEDVKIKEIYTNLPYKESICRNLMKIEKEVEVDVVLPIQENINLLKSLHDRGYQIIITTDMYLDKGTISKILDNNGIDYDELFISGEIGLSKEAGGLYRYILETCSGKIIHIGDNSAKDVGMAEKYGIHAFQYKSQNDPFNDVSFGIGYKKVGPFLVCFCKWVGEKKKREGIDELWFVAREGYLLKNIYEALYPEEKSVRYVRLNKNICLEPFSYVQGDSSSKEKYDILIDFLKEQKIEGKTIGLVNNSMSGNLQNMLEVITVDEFKTQFVGLQFVKSRNLYKLYPSQRSYGFLEETRGVIGLKSSFKRSCIMFEHILFEPCGTALRIKRIDNVLNIECDEQGEEKVNNKLVEKIQNSALMYANTGCSYNEVISMRKFAGFLCNPLKEEAIIGTLLYDKDMHSHLIAPPQKRLGFLEMIKNARSAKTACWPDAYLVLYGNPIVKALYDGLIFLRDYC